MGAGETPVPADVGTQNPVRTYRATLEHDGSLGLIPVPFDPKPVFGKVRAPVKITVNGFTYRTTIKSIGGWHCVPLRRSNRETAGLLGDETVNVILELDTEPRIVRPPADFVRALKASPPAWDRWRELSYSRQREHVDAIASARRPVTRTGRIAESVRSISGFSRREDERAKARGK